MNIAMTISAVEGDAISLSNFFSIKRMIAKINNWFLQKIAKDLYRMDSLLKSSIADMDTMVINEEDAHYALMRIEKVRASSVKVFSILESDNFLNDETIKENATKFINNVYLLERKLRKLAFRDKKKVQRIDDKDFMVLLAEKSKKNMGEYLNRT